MPAQDKDIKALAATFADTLVKLSKKTIAVVDFNDLQGNVTELGRYLAEQVSVALAMTDKGIEVIDRTHLKVLLQENKLSSSGIIDPATARKLGQIAGVDVLVTGTLTPFGDSVQLAVKALDATTAHIIGASTTDIAKTKAIEELLSRGITANAAPTPQPMGSATPNPSASIQEHGFLFEPLYCKTSGGNTGCLIRITNTTNQSVDFYVFATESQSTLIDDRGNQYTPKGMQFGNTGGRGSTNISKTVPPNLPMNLFLSYEDVSPSATRASLMLNLQGEERFAVVLRNIPLTK
jgi:TolB-like protein